MKAFERIFLYSVLALLVVPLVDGNVESQVAIQEEIRARSISIVNDAGQVVVNLYANEDGGIIFISNKAGARVALMGVLKDGDGGIGVYNKAGTYVAGMESCVSGGIIGVRNKAGTPIAGMAAYENDGMISVYNKQGDLIGSLP